MTAEGRSVPGLRAEVRAWLAMHAALAPAMAGSHEPMGYLRDPAMMDWIGLLRSGRWLCLSWPPEYGGRGLGPAEIIAVNEEFALAGAPRPALGMGESLVAPALLKWGTDEQKARFLPPILAGEDVYCQGFSEPESGSDLASLRTRGVLDGNQLVIDGDKIWQSGAHRANMIFVLCRTDDGAPRHRGISYVLVPMTGNGVTVRQIRMLTGDRGFNQVELRGARAPLDNVIGGLNNGWVVAMTTLGAERAGDATTQYLGYQRELLGLVDALGLCSADAASTADAASAVDRLPARLVDAYLEVQLMRACGLRIADELAAGTSPEALLAVNKVNWSEYHAWFGEMAIEELGLEGLLLAGGDYALTPFQRILLESRGRRIARGTNQIQRNIIAERILGLPR